MSEDERMKWEAKRAWRQLRVALRPKDKRERLEYVVNRNFEHMGFKNSTDYLIDGLERIKRGEKPRLAESILVDVLWKYHITERVEAGMA